MTKLHVRNSNSVIKFFTHLALSAWTPMYGITCLHLHGYLAGFLRENVRPFVDLEIERLMRSLGML